MKVMLLASALLICVGGGAVMARGWGNADTSRTAAADQPPVHPDVPSPAACPVDFGARVVDAGTVMTGVDLRVSWACENVADHAVRFVSQQPHCGACELCARVGGNVVERFYRGKSVLLEPGQRVVVEFALPRVAGIATDKRAEVLMGVVDGPRGWQVKYVARYGVDNPLATVYHGAIGGWHAFHVQLRSGEPFALHAASGESDGTSAICTPLDATCERWVACVTAAAGDGMAPPLLLSRRGVKPVAITLQ